MKATQDKALWTSAWMDTPLSRPLTRVKVAKVPDDLLDVPGTHLKLREVEWSHQKFGTLVSYSEQWVVVRSSDDFGLTPGYENTVWTGTAEEYRQMWTVD